MIIRTSPRGLISFFHAMLEEAAQLRQRRADDAVDL